ncbi:hypothetical protein ACFRCG_21900 [Embleya sp. NPDC056575]|uniref:hypothetical protein n=1 Tax=unclassified Embleya TaxID=2699296 RepID=UPI0036BD1F5F
MIARRLSGICAALSAVLVLSPASGCGDSANRQEFRIPEISEDQAGAIAEEYTRLVVEGIKAPAVDRAPSFDVSPCGEVMGGKDSFEKTFTALRIQNVTMPPRRQESVFRQARATIEGMGFRIRRFETATTAGKGAGTLTAMKPADGFSIILQTTASAEEVMIMVSSPCLARPRASAGGTPAPPAGRTS